jgi:Transposase DDE domain group 1
MTSDKLTRQQRRQTERTLKKIQVIPSDVRLTSSSGLGFFLEIFDQSPLAVHFKHCLPERKSHRSVGSYLLGLMMLAGHIKGVQNISAMRRVMYDDYLRELFYDEVCALRTLQDFLYDFSSEHVDKLNLFLNNMAKSILEHLRIQRPDKISQNFIIDMDSSHHEHYGDNIEGLWYNYKDQWCLASHVAFDQYGFCHGIELQPGNTKPGTGAAAFIEKIFKDHRQQRLRRLEGLDFFRGDSAYCNQAVIKKCLELGIHFTLTAHKATTQWHLQIEKTGLDWQPFKYNEEDLTKSKKSKHGLPKVEVARFYWEPSWSDSTLKIPMVVQRKWVTSNQIKDKASKHGQKNFFEELDTTKEDGSWEYYAIATNLPLSEWSLEEVIYHHRKRGNAENFIKESKYNFSLKNFPCEKLVHNQAWVCFAQIAHNLIRWIALLDNPDHPSFGKKIRDDFMFIPGKIVQDARGLILRVPLYAKEVFKKIEGWQFPGFNSARIFSTA